MGYDIMEKIELGIPSDNEDLRYSGFLQGGFYYKIVL
jgi:hypothetical protein